MNEQLAAEAIFSPQNMLLAVVNEFLSMHPQHVAEFIFLLEEMFLPGVADAIREYFDLPLDSPHTAVVLSD